MTQHELSRMFSEVVEKNDEYNEAVAILRNNDVRRIWLIGGFVYRTIASNLYGTEPPKIDLDFIIDHTPENPTLPIGWWIEKNNFGNYKYIRKNLSLDIVPITNIHSIVTNNLEPTIENYLLGTPLTIQSIAYDVSQKKVIGEVGISAALTQTVAVHNAEAMQYLSEKYDRSINSYILEKASSLGFKGEFLSK